MHIQMISHDDPRQTIAWEWDWTHTSDAGVTPARHNAVSDKLPVCLHAMPCVPFIDIAAMQSCSHAINAAGTMTDASGRASTVRRLSVIAY